MANNWIFYVPFSDLSEATLSIHSSVGGSTTLANLTDNRILSRMDVDSLGSYVSGTDELMYRIDFGIGNTKQPDFIAVVGHNLYQETASLRVYYDISDNASLTSPATILGGNAAVSTDEPIWVEPSLTQVSAKRYWWVLLDSISTSAYAGEILLGREVSPVSDPNWEQDVVLDIESGRVVNTSHGGYNWKTRMHGVKRGWQILYELLNDTDKDELMAWLEDIASVDTPFVFTDNGGTDYYYGEILGNIVKTPMQSGLTNISFTISEVIA